MSKQKHTAFSVGWNVALSMIGCAAMIAGDAFAQEPAQRLVTQGRAKTVIENLYKCPVKVGNHRVSAVGQITATATGTTARDNQLGLKIVF